VHSIRDKLHTKHEATKGNNNGHTKKGNKWEKESQKSRLTGQHEADLRKGKDGWDVTLNVPTGDDRVGVMESMKPLWMH
jgi:hypothetical protein